jgi:hypothetical protein
VHGFLPDQLRTVSCLDHLPSFECPSHILASQGREGLCTLLVMGSSSFQADWYGGGIGGIPRAPNCRIGHRVGYWHPSWAGTLEPVKGLGRASLICAFGFRLGLC